MRESVVAGIVGVLLMILTVGLGVLYARRGGKDG